MKVLFGFILACIPIFANATVINVAFELINDPLMNIYHYDYTTNESESYEVNINSYNTVYHAAFQEGSSISYDYNVSDLGDSVLHDGITRFSMDSVQSAQHETSVTNLLLEQLDFEPNLYSPIYFQEIHEVYYENENDDDSGSKYLRLGTSLLSDFEVIETFEDGSYIRRLASHTVAFSMYLGAIGSADEMHEHTNDEMLGIWRDTDNTSISSAESINLHYQICDISNDCNQYFFSRYSIR